MSVPDDRVITVCDKCLRACCWLGFFMCERARDAGTVKRAVRELRELPDDGNREHPDYWATDGFDL